MFLLLAALQPLPRAPGWGTGNLGSLAFASAMRMLNYMEAREISTAAAYFELAPWGMHDRLTQIAWVGKTLFKLSGGATVGAVFVSHIAPPGAGSN